MGDGGGGGGGEWGGGEDSFSLVFENSIVLIKCTLYDTVFQRQVSICRGVVFSYSFSIYCAAYHGIWCSDRLKHRSFLINLFVKFLCLSIELWSCKSCKYSHDEKNQKLYRYRNRKRLNNGGKVFSQLHFLG